MALLLLASCASPQNRSTQNQDQAQVQKSTPSLRVIQTPEERARSEARSQKVMVSTQGTASTQAALEILKQGGSVIDAAIAASFAISVERPHSTGLGGGGFLLYREAKTKRVYAIDFRERAPLKATREMFLDKKGNVIPEASTTGILSVAVPGLIPGLLEIHKRFGKLPLSTVIAPSVRLAREGFKIYPALAQALMKEKEKLAKYPESRAVFLNSDGSPRKEGEVLVQAQLANTLEEIGNPKTQKALMRRLHQAILEESRKYGGILSEEDFSKKSVLWRKPVTSSYRGLEVVSMSPPSSGGVHVIEILNILETDSLKNLGFGSAQAIHLTASASQLAFADRAEFMGDPDFFSVPTDVLVSKKYAVNQRARIELNRHTPSQEVKPGKVNFKESTSTTHFSIMDREGSTVASTQTINGWFGSHMTVPGFGVVLNNEMDDFVAKPGVANMFGALGGEANAIAPRKTPLSSMSPTIVLKKGEPYLALGAPGGTRIITCVAQTILNVVDYQMPLYEAVGAIRFHHQWSPDVLKIDAPGPSTQVVSELKKLGYELKIEKDAVPCRTMAVQRLDQELIGVSDQADAGSSAGL